ncbi:MAG: RluA family pseudouridine synthase [Planctomycetes bacterium]|nr:RluA family pseudouridine synthase [Planctomycetota bacterium]
MTGAGTTLTIGPDDAGQRVDRFLRKYLPRATFSLVFKLLRTKQVTLNGRRAGPEERLAKGDRVTLFLGERLRDLRGGEGRPGGLRPPGGAASPPLAVLFRDDHVLAVDKPARLLVHEGDAGDEPTLIDAVLRAFPGRRGHTFRPALAHRLDRDTSGVVLAGLSAEGLRGLEDALRRREVEKVYLALVVGVPDPREGIVDAPLRREDLPRGDRPKVSVGGARDPEAVTEYRVVGEGGGCALLEVRPRTGRTHQIRAHLRWIGHPILGDPTYGDRRRNAVVKARHGLWRQFLHAARVELDHPVTGERLVVASPLPGELARVLEGLGISARSGGGASRRGAAGSRRRGGGGDPRGPGGGVRG